jgi:hypothetical protein
VIFAVIRQEQGIVENAFHNLQALAVPISASFFAKAAGSYNPADPFRSTRHPFPPNTKGGATPSFPHRLPDGYQSSPALASAATEAL